MEPTILQKIQEVEDKINNLDYDTYGISGEWLLKGKYFYLMGFLNGLQSVINQPSRQVK